MYSPDEERSINSELNRDAAPHPEEARERERERLAAAGCVDCGEDDPDKLGRRFTDLQKGETVVLCAECAGKRGRDV